MKYLLLLGALVWPAAGWTAPVSFTKEIAPLLRTRCVACHITGTEPGKLSLIPAKAYTDLVNVKSSTAPKLLRVVPGKPAQSYMLMKLQGTHIAAGGSGARMPFGQPPLQPAQTELVRKWIAEGAKNN